jgi:thiol:disulfide interchange protein DsbD
MRHTLAAVVLALIPALTFAEAPVFTVAASWQGGPPRAGASAVLAVTVSVRDGWHINSNAPLDPYLIPTTIALQLPPGWSADAPVFPAHTLAKFAFSEDKVAVFQGAVAATINVHRAADVGAPAKLSGTVEAQACNDRVCLPPAELSFAVAAGGSGTAAPPVAAPTSSQQPPAPLRTYATAQTAPQDLTSRFRRGSLLLQLALVFLAGLALNLTPCVYPLIPITIGFFSAQSERSRGRTWLLALVYVLGMSVTYSALGVLAALTGRLFGSALQSPWLVGLVVAVLLALAASMFGAWELRVPAWATRASGGRSGAGGALVMGLVVGIVAAPCIGPFVLGLLTYVGQRQDVLLGFLLFFVLALGLGAPFLLLAVSVRALAHLPNSGAWMLGVRQLFGVLLVALAGYFVRPFVAPWGEHVFAGLLILGGLYLIVIARPGHEQPAVDRVMRCASAAVLVAGVLLFPRSRAAAGPQLVWQPYDEATVARALTAKQPVVLDFFATWCVPCKELDEKTFSDAEVAARLAGFARFKVDLSRADASTDAVRRRFNVAGVPTVAFYRDGVEVADARLTGFEAPPEFLRRLAGLAR